MAERTSGSLIQDLASSNFVQYGFHGVNTAAATHAGNKMHRWPTWTQNWEHGDGWRRWIHDRAFFLYADSHGRSLCKVERRLFYNGMITKIKACDSRHKLITLFEAYQNLKENNADVKRLMRKPTGALPRLLRWSRFQDHWNGQTFTTSKTDSLIIKAMKKRRDFLEREEKKRGETLKIDDLALKNFNRMAWYTSNTFLIGIGLFLAVAAAAAMIYFPGIMMIAPVALVASAIAFKMVIVAATVVAASIIWSLGKEIIHSFQAKAALKKISAPTKEPLPSPTVAGSGSSPPIPPHTPSTLETTEPAVPSSSSDSSGSDRPPPPSREMR